MRTGGEGAREAVLFTGGSRAGEEEGGGEKAFAAVLIRRKRITHCANGRRASRHPTRLPVNTLPAAHVASDRDTAPRRGTLKLEPSPTDTIVLHVVFYPCVYNEGAPRKWLQWVACCRNTVFQKFVGQTWTPPDDKNASTGSTDWPI